MDFAFQAHYNPPSYHQSARYLGVQDDTIIVISGNCLEDVQKKVESTTGKAASLLERAGLLFNEGKTEIVVFRGGQQATSVYQPLKFKVFGKDVTSSQCVKYLGVYIDTIDSIFTGTFFTCKRSAQI